MSEPDLKLWSRPQQYPLPGSGPISNNGWQTKNRLEREVVAVETISLNVSSCNTRWPVKRKKKVPSAPHNQTLLIHSLKPEIQLFTQFTN